MPAYLTKDWYVLIGTVIVSLLFASFPFFYDSDTYWHLANGREMVNAGHIISEEVFSYTHFGEKFANHEWLSQIIFYLTWDNLGPSGLFALKLAIVSLVVFFLYNTQRVLGVSPWLAGILCVFAVFAGLIRYTERPELFSLLNTTLLGFMLYSFRAGRLSQRWLWFIPLMLVVWDWLHGSVYGLVLLTVFVAGENAKHYLPTSLNAPLLAKDRLTFLSRCFAVTIIAMLVNPFGLLTYGIFVGILGGEGAATSSIKEYLPVNWKEFQPYILLFAWAGVLALRQVRRPDVTQLLLLAVFGAAALRFSRATGVSAIVLAPVIGSLTMALIHGSSEAAGKKIHNVSVALAATFILSSGFVVKILNGSGQDVGDLYYPASRTAFGYRFSEYVYPVGAVNFVQAKGVTGNLYNSGEYGGYLAYRITPERKIFQYNLPAVFGDTARLSTHPDELARSNITYAIATVGEAASFPSDGWARVYADPFSILFLRRIPQNADLIRQYEMRYFFPGFSADKLRMIARDPGHVAQLCFEMGVYLTYREDERIANIWAGMLTERPDLKNQPRIRELLESARKFNRAPALQNLAI